MDIYGFGTVLVTAVLFAVLTIGSGVYFHLTLVSKNRQIADGMLKGVITHQINELYKTAVKCNNINAPMRHLCGSLCIYLALTFDKTMAIQNANRCFESVRAGQSYKFAAGTVIPKVWIEMAPKGRLPHHIYIHIGNGGMQFMQDLNKVDNWDVLTNGLGPLG